MCCCISVFLFFPFALGRICINVALLYLSDKSPPRGHDTYYLFCYFVFLLKPVTTETRSSKVVFPNIQEIFRQKTRSYRRYGNCLAFFFFGWLFYSVEGFLWEGCLGFSKNARRCIRTHTRHGQTALTRAFHISTGHPQHGSRLRAFREGTAPPNQP